MSTSRTSLFRIATMLIAASSPAYAAPLDALSDSSGQLGTPLSWVDVPESDGLVHAVQFSRDGRLLLTPNESFFPKLGLIADGEGPISDIASLNGDKSFATITKWDQGDSAEWGLWITNPGQIELSVRMSGDSGRFTISIGEQSESFSLRAGSKPSVVSTAKFQIAESGRHSVILTCDESDNTASLHWIEVSGPTAEGGGVLRKRWRPAAAHTRFSSSRSPDKVRLWVMEMDAVPGDLDFYCPITTPFGYYGPTWAADGTVNTSFNFSLWSFARGAAEPPIEQLSHLLAVGNPEASFDGFDHEGTGVKIRDWEPLLGRQGQRQTLALRVEPGEVYDTYFSYFYANDEKRWRLFGVGNKYNGGKPLQSLWVGSFVEVPGPPQNQRSGAWERRMRYRGWVMDEKGAWYPLDRMERGNIDKETGLTHTDRGVTEDGWFYLQTGGWFFRKIRDDSPVELRPPSGKPVVDYLGEDDIAFLTSLPSEITVTKLERADSRARITFTVRNASQSPKATVYWGESEGLSLAERWPNQTEIKDTLREGENQFILENVPTEKPLFVRLLMQNDEGKFWSPETISRPAP